MIKKINKFFNPKLETLIFFVTTKCPLKCKHCFYSSELNQISNELSLEEIKKISDKLLDLRLLQLSGGEPFMRDDLVDIIEIFFKNGLEKVTIPTNGFFIENIINKVKKMQEKNFNLQIMVSLDGFKETHNSIRGKDCFGRALKTFDELKKLDVNVGFNVALSKLNYDSFIELLKFLKKRTNNIDAIIVRAKPDVMLSAEQFLKIIKEVEELTSDDLTPFYKKRREILNEIYYNVLKGKEVPFHCRAGEVIAVLEPDGQVRACEILKKLGNVRDHNYDLNKILKLKKIPKRCKGCIHPCFIGPSLSYNLKWFLKNITYQYA